MAMFAVTYAARVGQRRTETNLLVFSPVLDIRVESLIVDFFDSLIPTFYLILDLILLSKIFLSFKSCLTVSFGCSRAQSLAHLLQLPDMLSNFSTE